MQWLRGGVPIKILFLMAQAVDGLDGADSLCISPDGCVYVTGAESNSVNCFERNTVTGALEHVSSIFDGENGVDGLDDALDVEISGDGKHVYITAIPDKSISWFLRNTLNGALTYGGTLKDNIDGVDGLDGSLLLMEISEDGDHVYVSANGDNSVSWFSRNKTTGALTFAGILKDGSNGIDFLNGSSYVTLSHDGLHAYVTAPTDNTICWFDRNSVSGDLQFSGKITGQVDISESLAGIDFITISNDDKKVFS